MPLTNHVLLSGLFTLSLLGCQGEVLDVPGGGGGEGTGGGGGESGSIVYRGQYLDSIPFEGFTMKRVEITFSSLSESKVEGTIVFGDAARGLPEMDVTTAYPIGSGFGTGWNPSVFEGYPYPVTGTLSDGILRLEYDIRGPFEPWCAAQESLLVPETTRLDPGQAYYCTPYANAGTSCPDGMEPCFISAEGLPTLEVDLRHHNMCVSRICTCTDSGCAITDESVLVPLLPLVLDDDKAESDELLLRRQ